MADQRILLLGPVELGTHPHGRRPVTGAKRAATLALLGMEINRVVTVDHFCALLWGRTPPPRAKAALQGHIAALRRELAGSGLSVATHPAGYELIGDAESVDVHRFGALVRASAERPDAERFELLRQALDLWHGTALTGLPDTETRDALVRRLEQDRLLAVEAWAEVGLRQGQAQAVLPALRQAAAGSTREPLVALLMLALAGAGEREAALELYEHTRERLAVESGIAPGGRLREALRRVREPVPQARPVEAYLAPHLLPRPIVGFVERADERAWLDRTCLPAGGAARRLAVVTGPAGSGKTSLAVYWAHSVADRFPDGQLYADLRGFNTHGPADPGDVLYGFLRATGVPEDAIPAGTRERAELYRSQTRGRRLLIVLDNVLCADDLGPFLPGGEAYTALVCSRNALEQLVLRETTACLPVGPFTPSAAWELMRRRLGDRRSTQDPAASRRLVELCGHLPLALSIALARLAARPGWTVADLVAELEDERTRLGTLGTPGEISVARELSLSRRQLTSDASRLLPLLALHPGTEVDAPAAAALLAAPMAAGQRALDALAALHLTTEADTGRYHAHDLVRLYCLELLNQEVDGPDRLQAVRRLADYYLAATASANLLVSGRGVGLWRPADGSSPDLPRHRDQGQALRWFSQEEQAVRGLLEACAAAGDVDRAWRLADNAAALYHAAARHGGWLDCLEAGLRSAERSADPAAQARLHSQLGVALTEMGRSEEALHHLERALDQQLGEDDSLHRARTLPVMATALRALGHEERSRQTFTAALGAARQVDDPWPEAYVLAHLCYAGINTAPPAEALPMARRVRELMAERPSAHVRLAGMGCEADALDRLGETEAAERVWREILDLNSRSGNDHVQAIVEAQFAEFLVRRGRHREARLHLGSAIELFRRRDDGRSVAALTRRLSELD